MRIGAEHPYAAKAFLDVVRKLLQLGEEAGAGWVMNEISLIVDVKRQ